MPRHLSHTRASGSLLSNPAEGHPLQHIRFQGWLGAALPRPRLPQGPREPREDSREHTDALVLHVLAGSGLDPNDYRTLPLNRRVTACLRALKVCTTVQAIKTLQDRPDLLPCALDALLIGVGDFFRDPGVMAALARHLPELARQRGDELRAWSAGCGNGSELYSLAIMLAEAGLLAGSSLLGTDCRPAAIATASRGVYSEEAIRQVPVPLRNRYFAPLGGAWRVTLPSEGKLSWQAGNVLREPPEGLWDIIVCRNVAIYLKREVGCALWATLVSRLRPGGLLVVGNAEQPAVPGLDILDRCIYRTRGGTDA